jgi:hypothetical protein
MEKENLDAGAAEDKRPSRDAEIARTLQEGAKKSAEDSSGNSSGGLHVAKTLKDNNFIFGDMLKKLDPIVSRTKIDMDACIRVVGRIIGDKEAALQAGKAAKKSAPGQFELPKETIPADRCKPASLCGATWEEMSGSDRLRLCSQCQSFVYDFSGLELPEAEKLVFQRESKDVPFFYRRQDGRFLSRDCPVGLSTKNAKLKTIVIAAAGAIVAIIFLLLIPMLMPPPKPQETPVESTQPQENLAGTPGTFHPGGSKAATGTTTTAAGVSSWSSNVPPPARQEPGQYNPDMQAPPTAEPGFVPSPDAEDVSVPQTGLETAPAPAASSPAQAVPAPVSSGQTPPGSDQNAAANPAPAPSSEAPSQPNGVWQAPR